ncbi:aminotransferase class V-fold PLP-dependent enzyme [Sphaerisporangium aureirubrum]|uniref:Aminotransferase class V-fold PLP-dependent enzyme n=1 Tax=Sphaerisporangium aureirubrum TaxID=1544736 RepID=A0ABW1NFR0_9ACTN
MVLTRRAMMAGLGAAAATYGAPPAAAVRRAPPAGAEPEPPALFGAPKGVTPDRLARDEGFWEGVARRFQVSPDFVNLENGYYGIMPDPVRAAYHRAVDRLNRENSHLLRTTYRAEADRVRERVAAVTGVRPDELALTRGGTEALQNLLAGYRRLAPGDVVMYADLDYHSTQYTMNWLKERRGVRVARLVVPEPATRAAVLDAYAKALREHPRTRLLLISHMNNRTGLVLPVAELVAMAREAGADAVVDAAHSWGQLDFTIPGLGADFAGFSLHKWMGAPLGSGFLYIRRDRLDDIDLAFADESFPRDDIRSRVHSGTMDVAPILVTPVALDFHDALGAAVKQARLRYLRDRWVEQVRHLPGVEILTPDDPAMYGAITSFRLTGRTSEADNLAIVKHLLDRHRVFTVRRGGLARGDCVRVTPALFTSAGDVDLLAKGLRELAGRPG